MCLHRRWHLCSHVLTRPRCTLHSLLPHPPPGAGDAGCAIPCHSHAPIHGHHPHVPSQGRVWPHRPGGHEVPVPVPGSARPLGAGGGSIGLSLMVLGEEGNYLLAVVLQIATLRRGNKSHPFVLVLLKIFYKVPTFPVQLNGFLCRKLPGQRGTVEENIIYNDSQTHKNTLPSLAILPPHNKHLVSHS